MVDDEGGSEPSRSILGRHASATSGTYAFYSRDLCVAPTREMHVVIDEIFKGNFNPDAPRSAYFTRCEPMIETESGSALMCAPEVGSLAKAETTDSECVQSETQEEHEPIVVQDDSSSESSSSEAGSSADSSCGEEPPTKVKRFRPRVPRDESWYVHRRSHISSPLGSRLVATLEVLDNGLGGVDVDPLWLSTESLDTITVVVGCDVGVVLVETFCPPSLVFSCSDLLDLMHRRTFSSNLTSSIPTNIMTTPEIITILLPSSFSSNGVPFESWTAPCTVCRALRTITILVAFSR